MAENGHFQPKNGPYKVFIFELKPPLCLSFSPNPRKYIKLFWADCVPTNVVCALADIVAAKLGIILLLFSFFLSFHVLFSQKGFVNDFEFLHAFLSNKKIRFWRYVSLFWVPKQNGMRALWESQEPLWRMRYFFLSFHLLISQKVFPKFVHAFLSNKRNKI